MITVAPKTKTSSLTQKLEKKRGFAQTTHSDTNTCHWAEHKANVFVGVWTIRAIKRWALYCVLFCRYISNKLFKIIQSFSKLSFWEIELTKHMTDLEDKNILGKIVFDNKNQERKSWTWLGQTCSKSPTVFLTQLFVFLLIIFDCFWKIHLSKTCDEATVWVGTLCSAAGYILPSPKFWTS